MKTSLILLTMLLVISVRAYPPAPASQAAVNAGTEPYLYVTPATLAGAGLGLTTNQTAILNSAVTNGQSFVRLNLLNEVQGSCVVESAEGAISCKLTLFGDVAPRIYATNEVSRVFYMSGANPINDISLVYQNYNGIGGNPTGPINGSMPTWSTNMSPLNIQCAVEYPDGVIHVCTFNCGATNAICNTNSIVQTDALTIGIPPNTPFWVRTFISAAIQPGGWFESSQDSSLADAYKYPTYQNYSAVGSNDITFANLINTNHSFGYLGAAGLSYYTYEPSAIIGSGQPAAVGFFGDSISTYSSYLGAGHSSPLEGFIYAGISTNLPVVGMNQYGDKMSYNLTNINSRLLIALKSCDRVINQLGINDFSAVSGVFSVMTNRYTTFWNMLATNGLKVWQTTLSPATYSSDNWATTGNQTIEYDVTAINNWIRSCPPPLSGYIEVADTVMTARNSGIWKVNGVAQGYTYDGLHPATNGVQSMATAIAAWAAGQKQNTFVGTFTGNGGGLTNLLPAGLSSYTATNILTVTTSGLTNNTTDTYSVAITAGTAMALKDGNGTQFLTPILGASYPLKPNWRLTGTAITGTAVIMSK